LWSRKKTRDTAVLGAPFSETEESSFLIVVLAMSKKGFIEPVASHRKTK
jgi:hypothetical protein